MRRLAALTSTMAAFETLFYSALAPLLPSFKEELGLSKAQAGLLVAAYAIGLGVAALPVGLLASRIGVKETALTGLVVLAVTSVCFGFVDDYEALLATRFLQGAAGALCWSGGLAWLVDAASPERRGTMIGTFAGAGAAGQVVGPAVGALAVLAGRASVFSGLAVAAVLLAVLGARHPRPATREYQSLALIRKAHASRSILASQLLVVLPGLLLGVIGVLGPLELSRLGAGPAQVAGTFLAAAALGVLSRPIIGGWADRRGDLVVTRVLLVAAIPITLVMPWPENPWVLSGLVMVAVSTYGLIWAPVMAHLSRRYEEQGVPQALGFALMNLSAGGGIVIGSAGGAGLADIAGDVASYAVIAAVCLAVVALLAHGSRDTGTHSGSEVGALPLRP